MPATERTPPHTESRLAFFLKKYSPIPNGFIDDMFALYNQDTLQTDCVVDIDAVAKWLGVRKDSLMVTLRTSYKQGVDFTVDRVRNPNAVVGAKYGINSYKRTLVTPDCFKRLCMRSHGKMAEHVRTYFIQVENLVVKYRQQLLDGMQKDMERIESAARARGSPKASAPLEGYIYVLRASEKHDSVFKIGRTRDLSRRLREHSAALADVLEVVYVFKTDDVKAVETCVKGWLRERQWKRASCNEVYKADLEMVKQVIQGCDAVGGCLKHTLIKTKNSPRMTGGFFIAVSKG